MGVEDEEEVLGSMLLLLVPKKKPGMQLTRPYGDTLIEVSSDDEDECDESCSDSDS